MIMHLVQLGARQHAIATGGGWALSPGLAASGNDNKDAQPEVLVCIRNLAAVAGSATVRSIDWTDGAYADSATFDITLTFDEAIDFTSATATENQTVTNKAYILLNRLGATDMVEDNTILPSIILVLEQTKSHSEVFYNLRCRIYRI